MTDRFQDIPTEELKESEVSSPKRTNLRPYLRIFRRKAWLIFGISSLTTIAGLIWSSLDPHSYIGNFYLLVEPITSAAKLTDPTTLARTGGVPQEELFALDYPTNLVFLKSPGMTYRIAKDVHEKQKDRAIPAIWKDLRDNLTVNRIGTTSSTATKIFEVSYKGEDPDEVQAILETAASTFLKYSAEDRETSLKAGVSFIDKQLPDFQKRLNKLQSQQQQLRQQYELLDPSTKGQEVLLQIKEIEQQQLTINTQLKAQKALYTSLQEQLNFNPTEAIAASTLSQDAERVTLLAKLQEVDSQIAVESARFTSDSPVLQTLEEQKQNLLQLLEQKTQKILQQNSIVLSQGSSALTVQNPTRLKLIEQLVETSNQIQILEVQSRSLATTKEALDQQSKRYPGVIRQYQEIDRQIALTTQIIDRLQTQGQTLQVESAQELPWQLISKPQVPLDKDGKPISYPPDRTKKVLAALAGGLLFSSALAFLLEKRKNIFYTAEDIRDTIPHPLLGEIPWDGVSAMVPPQLEAQLSEKPETPAIELKRGHSYAFESALNDLYTQLCLLNQDSSVRSLTVCSVEPEEGQTTIAVYLAKAAAVTGKRVLLVDANWQDPQLHEWLNVPNYKGLYHLLLADTLKLDEVIQTVQNCKNLDILTSGLSEPIIQKRIWSTKMQEIMKQLHSKYDLVIYELPHFFNSTDVSFITSQTDGMLMVVGVATTRQSLVKKAIKELDKFDIPCLGIVANHLSDGKPPLL